MRINYSKETWAESPQKVTRLSDGSIAFLDINYKGSKTSQQIHPIKKGKVVYGVALSSDSVIKLPKYGEVVLTPDLIEELFFTYSAEAANNGSMKITRNGKAIDCGVVEMWICKDPLNDKSKALGLKGVKKGSVIVGLKSKSTKVLNDILSMGSFSSINLNLPFDSLLRRK